MFNSFPDCMKALMENPGLHAANGGLVVKVEGGFDYSLHGAPEPEGEPFVKVNRSYAPGETWTASFLNWLEAEQGYQDFNREFPIIVVDESD
jgi:hypothetical protein